ncbi:hypothetical protein MCOR02_012171 [Pyricularia oryzae]|nr:hypothetical protein MCOR02_012171 [Pyricularia oryzae]KAI6479545.1 hypothetical protein MCOR13_011427 [Pyricularia oryzae]
MSSLRKLDYKNIIALGLVVTGKFLNSPDDQLNELPNLAPYVVQQLGSRIFAEEIFNVIASVQVVIKDKKDNQPYREFASAYRTQGPVREYLDKKCKIPNKRKRAPTNEDLQIQSTVSPPVTISQNIDPILVASSDKQTRTSNTGSNLLPDVTLREGFGREPSGLSLNATEHQSSDNITLSGIDGLDFIGYYVDDEMGFTQFSNTFHYY